MRRNRYKMGDYLVVDDFTGNVRYASTMKMTWDGWLTDKKNWYRRHPQQYVRGVKENQTVPIPRPRQPNGYIIGGSPELDANGNTVVTANGAVVLTGGTNHPVSASDL